MTACVINLIEQAHRPKALAMIAEAFAKDDPLAHSQAMRESDFHDFIDGLYDNFVADRLSFVAIDSDTDRIAAIVLAEVYRSTPGDEGSDAITALFAIAREAYFADYSPLEGELMHISFVASNPDYRRQRLAHQLCEHCLAEARDRGYSKAMVEASGIRSRTLLEQHLGFQAQVSTSYADFEWRGELPFSSIADHGGMTIMDRVL